LRATFDTSDERESTVAIFACISILPVVYVVTCSCILGKEEEVIGIPEVVVAMGMFLTVVVDELVTFKYIY
jgi:hypothetical protein